MQLKNNEIYYYLYMIETAKKDKETIDRVKNMGITIDDHIVNKRIDKRNNAVSDLIKYCIENFYIENGEVKQK